MGKKIDFVVRVSCMTYNQEPYITDALNGFVMQQTSFPFVCTIVDDASTDRNAEVIRDYVSENFDLQDTSIAYEKDMDYGHVTFARHKTNQNCFFAVIYLKENHYSQGKSKEPYMVEWSGRKYIAICEGDDYWTDPLKLQKQVEFLEGHEDVGFVGSNVWLDVNGKLKKEERNLPALSEEGDFILMGNVFESAKYGPITRTVSLVYRRVLVQPYNKYICGDIVLQSVLAKHSDFAYYREFSCVYRMGVGVSASNNNLNRELRYNDWYVKCRRMQNSLFPDDCCWPEDELEDRGTYIRLRYAIQEMKLKEAKHYKAMLKSPLYRNKKYARYFKGPFTGLVLWLTLKFK